MLLTPPPEGLSSVSLCPMTLPRYPPLALSDDSRHPIMLLATLGSVTLVWICTLIREGKLLRKESGRPSSSSSSWKLSIIF